MSDKKKLTLNINSLSNEKKDAIAQRQKELNILLEKAEKEKLAKEKKESIKTILAFLQKKFRKCFNHKNPIPLKLQIELDLLNDISVSTKIANKEFTQTQLKDAIKFYAQSIKYHNAIINNDARFNLQGIPDGEITEKHKKYSSQSIKFLNNIKKKHSTYKN